MALCVSNVCVVGMHSVRTGDQTIAPVSLQANVQEHRRLWQTFSINLIINPFNILTNKTEMKHKKYLPPCSVVVRVETTSHLLDNSNSVGSQNYADGGNPFTGNNENMYGIGGDGTYADGGDPFGG